MDIAAPTPAPSPSPQTAVASAAAPQTLMTVPSFAVTPQRAVILAVLAAGAYNRKVIMAKSKHTVSFLALVALLVWNERRGRGEGYCSKCGH